MRFTTGLLATLVLAAGPALAADDSFYVGVGMGYSKININETKLNNSISGELPLAWSFDRSSVDQYATPYQFVAGYRLMPYLGFEASYMDMGSADYKAQISTGNGGKGVVKGTWSADGWPVSVLGIYPIDDTFEVFGRLGAFFGSVDMKASAVDAQTGARIGNKYHASENSNQFIGGVGVDAKFLDSWAARVEWQAMPSLGNDDTGSGNFNNFMFSVLYKF